MGYGWESRHGQFLAADAATLAAIAFQTPADKATFTCYGPITVLQIGTLITTAVTAVAAVVDFDKRVTYGSDTGRVARFGGTMTIPIGAAIGQFVYKEVQLDLNPGEQLMGKLATASTAGGGIFYVQWIPRAEMPTNYAHMIKSV